MQSFIFNAIIVRIKTIKKYESAFDPASQKAFY